MLRISELESAAMRDLAAKINTNPELSEASTAGETSLHAKNLSYAEVKLALDHIGDFSAGEQALLRDLAALFKPTPNFGLPKSEGSTLGEQQHRSLQTWLNKAPETVAETISGETLVHMTPTERVRIARHVGRAPEKAQKAFIETVIEHSIPNPQALLAPLSAETIWENYASSRSGPMDGGTWQKVITEHLLPRGKDEDLRRLAQIFEGNDTSILTAEQRCHAIGKLVQGISNPLKNRADEVAMIQLLGGVVRYEKIETMAVASGEKSSAHIFDVKLRHDVSDAVIATMGDDELRAMNDDIDAFNFGTWYRLSTELRAASEPMRQDPAVSETTKDRLRRLYDNP